MKIKNLHHGVRNHDIKGLFSKFESYKCSGVYFDGSGRSMGAASVVFEKRSDALKAIKEYNGVRLDGKPLKISFVEGKNSSPPITTRKWVSNVVKRLHPRSADYRSSPKVTKEQLDLELDTYPMKPVLCVLCCQYLAKEDFENHISKVHETIVNCSVQLNRLTNK